jgi:pimeloyl-ACP methyl ester carboxylesterase
MVRAAHPAGAAAALRGRAERPCYEETLASLKIPALVLVGDEDFFTTRADAERMRDLLQGSELVWMEGAGHMPNLEREAEFNAALERFLHRFAPPSGGRMVISGSTKAAIDDDGSGSHSSKRRNG